MALQLGTWHSCCFLTQLFASLARSRSTMHHIRRRISSQASYEVCEAHASQNRAHYLRGPNVVDSAIFGDLRRRKSSATTYYALLATISKLPQMLATQDSTSIAESHLPRWSQTTSILRVETFPIFFVYICEMVREAQRNVWPKRSNAFEARNAECSIRAI